MAGITGISDTYDLPNYVGELFALTPEDTPLTSSIGGLTGGERATSTIIQWQTYDLRDAAQNTVVEANTAPTAQARVRANVTNVLQIHHETIETSYTKQGATGQFADVGSSNPQVTGIQGASPVGLEHAWQTEQMIKQMARDIEFSFLRGVFAEGSTIATARQTRGLINAISTNTQNVAAAVAVASGGTATGEDADDILDGAAFAAHGLNDGDQVQFTSLTGGSSLELYVTYYVVSSLANSFQIAATSGGSALDFGSDITDSTVIQCGQMVRNDLLDLMQDVWDQGGIMEGETRTVICNSYNKRVLTQEFITDANYREMSRNVGGVAVTAIETDFGNLNIMVNRHMTNGALIVCSLEQLAPVFLEVPGKGFFFQEPLAKTGLYERTQLVTEVGLKYGNERQHGLLLGLTASGVPA